MRRRAMDRRIWAIALVAAAAAIGGCTQWRLPRIDPTGEHIFAPSAQAAPAGGRELPADRLRWDTVEVLLVPRATVAPIGAEVVLLAGVAGSDGYLRTNERVEWSIAPGSAGEFVDVNPAGICDVFVGDFTRPRKLTPTFAVGSTSRSNLRLTRGTPDPTDDVLVHSGQTWITVTSATEGTSYVTAYAPDVYGWDRHKQTAAVHWIDAQWRLPPPAINPAGGRHLLTTAIVRQSDQSPRAGWRVQYTIAGGPAAGFAPNGAPTIEVETDALGQATAELFQPQPAAGTNVIGIQIIRPALAGEPAGARLAVAGGSTLVTWSAPGIAVRTRGPAVAAVGAAITYRVEVTNTGDLPADGIVIVDEIPAGTTYLNSTPAGQLTGPAVRWEIGRLAPGECRYVELSLRADQAGRITNRAAAAAAGGLEAADAAATEVSVGLPAAPSLPSAPPGAAPGGPAEQRPQLTVNLTGPLQATVGQEVTFELTIANVGWTTATGIVIRDQLDPGLFHEKADANRVIRRAIRDLAPGQSERVLIVLRVDSAGRLCHTVEVTAAGGFRTTVSKCITATGVGAGVPAAPGIGPAPPEKAPAPAALVSIRISTAAVKDRQGDFLVEVANLTRQTLSDVQVRHYFDPVLEVKGARGQQVFIEADGAAVWTIPTLSPGATQSVTIVCDCLKPVDRVSVRVRAVSQGKLLGEQQASLPLGQAAPAPGATGLRISMTATTEPVRSGREFTYVIEISNQGTTAESQVDLSVTLPKELIPAPLGTTGPTLEPDGAASPRRPDIQGQTIRFATVAKLAARQVARYRVGAQATTVATSVKVTTTATVRTQSQILPLTEQVQTTINPQ